MKAKHHLILYTFLGLATVIAIFLAMDYGLRGERSRQALEDSYSQRMLEAQEHLQAVAVKLSKAPAAGSARTQVELLAGVSRQADGAAGCLSALPLSHVAMSSTIKFCNQLSEYALSLALLSASGKPLDESDAKRLSEMENQCTLLLGQFATARAEMLENSLRMAGEESVYYEPAQLALRPVEQVADEDNGMDYPAMIYDGAFSDARHLGAPKALGNEMIDRQGAVEAARAFVGAERVVHAEESVATGGVIPCYGVRLTLADGTVLNADVTRQGGKMLWLIPEHASFEAKLTLEECTQAARRFLESRGFGTMEANHYQVYDGLAVINFVAVQDGVLLYPDLVKVQMRMDTGELVGLESNNYLMNHTQRTSLSPKWSQQQALDKISPRLQVQKSCLCVIPYRDSERLCWESIGTYEENEYRVYIDANNGEEIQVLLMVSSPLGQMAA